MNIKEVRKLIQDNLVKVTFTKANGEQRVLLCSTNPKYLPAPEERDVSDSKKSPTISDTTVSAFDVEIKEWRSFRLDRMLSIEIVNT